MTLDLVAQHLGALHPIETVLTLVLAFGPFLVLFVVIAVRRRQDDAAQAAAPAEESSPERVGQR